MNDLSFIIKCDLVICFYRRRKTVEVAPADFMNFADLPFSMICVQYRYRNIVWEAVLWLSIPKRPSFSLAACAAAPDTPAAEEQPDCISDPTTQQLAAPVEAAMAQYPNETKYTASNGNFDSEKYDEDWDAWWESYQEKTADMTDPAAMTHWFTTSIPALMQDAGKENRVCSPLNIYMALSMLAAVTDGQTRQQILDALGAESLELLQKQAAQLWAENSWDDGLVTSTLANSIWLRDEYSYNEETLQKLGEEFYASAFSGEMGTDAYNNMLRDWINEHTGKYADRAGKRTGACARDGAGAHLDDVLPCVMERQIFRLCHDAGRVSRAGRRCDCGFPAQQRFQHGVLRRWLLGHRAFAGEQRPDVAAETGRGRGCGGAAAKQGRVGPPAGKRQLVADAACAGQSEPAEI